jgi:hypothetical protein
MAATDYVLDAILRGFVLDPDSTLAQCDTLPVPTLRVD